MSEFQVISPENFVSALKQNKVQMGVKGYWNPWKLFFNPVENLVLRNTFLFCVKGLGSVGFVFIQVPSNQASVSNIFWYFPKTCVPSEIEGFVLDFIHYHSLFSQVKEWRFKKLSENFLIPLFVPFTELSCIDYVINDEFMGVVERFQLRDGLRVIRCKEVQSMSNSEFEKRVLQSLVSKGGLPLSAQKIQSFEVWIGETFLARFNLWIGINEVIYETKVFTQSGITTEGIDEYIHFRCIQEAKKFGFKKCHKI